MISAALDKGLDTSFPEYILIGRRLGIKLGCMNCSVRQRG